MNVSTFFLVPFSRTVWSSWKTKYQPLPLKGLKEEDYYKWRGEGSRCGEMEAPGRRRQCTEKKAILGGEGVVDSVEIGGFV